MDVQLPNSAVHWGTVLYVQYHTSHFSPSKSFFWSSISFSGVTAFDTDKQESSKSAPLPKPIQEAAAVNP